MSYLFESLLKRIPKNRSELVNELSTPDDVIKNTSYESSQEWSEPEVSMTSDSVFSETLEDLVFRPKYRPSTASTESSIALSRAMTDSEIDYGMFRRMRDRRLSDPWAEMRARLDAFPLEYLASMESCMSSSCTITEESERPRPASPRLNKELQLKMERFFNEIQVFTPDDESLTELEEAIRNIDLESLELDLENI